MLALNTQESTIEHTVWIDQMDIHIDPLKFRHASLDDATIPAITR